MNDWNEWNTWTWMKWMKRMTAQWMTCKWRKWQEMNEVKDKWMPQTNETNDMTEMNASLRNRNACQDFTRATSYGNLQENAAEDWDQNADTHFARACVQSKRMSRFYTRRFIRKFTGNRPQKRVTTLIKHQPSHLPSEPLSVDTLSGEECFYILAAK